MSASRLFTLVGASFCRTRLRHHSTPVFLFYLKPPPVISINIISSSSSSLYFPRYSSSSAAPLEANSSTTTTPITGFDDVEASSVILTDHPWPEWVAFVDNLKNKGYFTRYSAAGDAGSDDGDAVSDLSSLKVACLNFARDRFDIFKYISKNEIRALVDKGCPNLFRKAVNSGKRLRAYLQLKEEDVCNVCVLRGSCDRAFYLLKDFEATARTVDVVRLLMLYAIDPLVSSGDVKTPDRVAIEASARRLLTQLIDLSETERDPHLIDHDVEANNKRDQSKYEDNEYGETRIHKNKRDQSKFELNEYGEMRNHSKKWDQSKYEDDDFVEMRKGDWKCPQCNFLNFSRNMECRKCGEHGPRKVGGNEIEMKEGDWVCTKCEYMNFARNVNCLRCKSEGPKRASIGERKEGDWDCQKCGFMNFARNASCKRCQDPRTEGRPEGRPGDWECPKCRYWNYARNTSCKKCDIKKPY